MLLDDHLPRHPEALPGVEALLSAVAATPDSRHRERLRYWLARWAADRNAPSRYAAILHDTVMRTA